MEFVHLADVPGWVSDVVSMLDDDGDIGTLFFRNSTAVLRDSLPVVFIGCGEAGVSTSYSSNVTEIIDSLSGTKTEIRAHALDEEIFGILSRISIDTITSKYYQDFGNFTMLTIGSKCVAICDVYKSEIYIPDFTHGLSWIDDETLYIESIYKVLRYAVDLIKRGHIDSLIRDIKEHSAMNTHVKYVEVAADTTFDVAKFSNGCLDSLKSYEEIVDNRYLEIFKNLRNDATNARNQGVVEALSLITYMKGKHFIFVTPTELKYTGGKVLATTGVFEDSLYFTKEPHWVSGIRIFVEDEKIYNATCYRAYHPNCSGRHICLGELMNIPLRDADKIITALSVPNFSNGYWTGPGSYIGEKISDIEGSGERVWSD